MEDLHPNYLSRIPDELKIEIFSYLNTIDIIQLWQIPTFEHLSYDKNLISNICLYKEYKCGIGLWNKFILNKFRSEVITSLNINCVYWIPAFELRKCLDKLHMLESFYAVDTKLGLTAKDSDSYKSLKHLKTLAVTVVDRELESSVTFPPTMVNLYLHLELIKHESVTKLSYLLSKLKFLEELWVIDLSPARAQITVMRILCLLPSSIRKLTLMIHRVSDFALVGTLNIKGMLTFKNFRKDMVQMSFEKFDLYVNNIYNCWDFKDVSWETLINRLKYDHPFGERDAKRLILGQSTPENLEFEELNITHSKDVCSNLFKSTAELLLISPNMQLLKKLSINFCMCERQNLSICHNLSIKKQKLLYLLNYNGKRNPKIIFNQPVFKGGNEISKKEEPLFKRARVGVSNSLPRKSALEKIIENSPLIEELEIWACTASSLSKITNAALSSIQNIKNLKNLTLHSIPEHIDGQFLVSICKNCENLSSLRIKTSKGNNSLHNHLCMALPYATALKDFRYERSYMPMDKIIESLNEATNLNLERMVLKCHSTEKFSSVPFQKYLSSNPQLKFLCIVITDVPKYVIRDISKSLNSYKTSPEKIFIATNDESSYTGRLPIPHIHRREMLNLNTSISALNIFNGFTNH